MSQKKSHDHLKLSFLYLLWRRKVLVHVNAITPPVVGCCDRVRGQAPLLHGVQRWSLENAPNGLSVVADNPLVVSPHHTLADVRSRPRPTVDTGSKARRLRNWREGRRVRQPVGGSADAVGGVDAKLSVKALPRSWVVERAVGWMIPLHRFARDRECRVDVAESAMHIASLRRLPRSRMPNHVSKDGLRAERVWYPRTWPDLTPVLGLLACSAWRGRPIYFGDKLTARLQ